MKIVRLFFRRALLSGACGMLAMVMLVLSACSQSNAPEWTAGLPAYSQFDGQGRDGKTDFLAAVSDAQRTHRRILVLAGGSWCGWCRLMDRSFNENAELARLMTSRYVVLHVYLGRDGRRDGFFDDVIPASPAAPWIYILDENGKYLFQKDTSDFEADNDYNLGKIADFMQKSAG